MDHGNLNEIVTLLAAAVVIVTVFRRLNLSPVLGYLVAGGMIGPFGLGIITDLDSTRTIAEFGVVFLLFVIGLELTFERLKAMRKHVFGFGTLQVVITGAGVGWFVYLLGISPTLSLVIGASLALSSTGIVLQILAEKNDQSTQVGRLSLATLILQDLAVVPLIILVPLLAGDEAQANLMLLDWLIPALKLQPPTLGILLLDSLLVAALAIGAIFVVGMRLLRPAFNLVGSLGSQELFTATTLLVVLGMAFLTAEAKLSLALGAFVAGLLVAETEFRPQVETDIRPFKGLLMGLFFMTVGMSIDFSLLVNEALIIFGLTFLLIAYKAIVIIMLARLFGFRRGPSIEAGLLLAQGSEFAFILFALAYQGGLMDGFLAQMILVIVSVSMAVTPLLASLGSRISNRLDRKKRPSRLENEELEQETVDLNNHIIVAGFGRVGQTVCTLLAAEDIHNYVAIDHNPRHVRQGRNEGYSVYYGDAERIDILQSLGIARAKMVVVTIADREHSVAMVECVSKHFPALPIVARAFDRVHAKQLRDAGAKIAMAEAFESSLLLGGQILRMIGVSDVEIQHVMTRFRAEEYPASLMDGLLKVGNSDKA